MTSNINIGIRYILFFISGLIFVGCTARMEIKTDNAKPILSVYAMLTTSEERQSVTLSSTAPFFTNDKNEKVTGAVVTIKGDNGELWTLSDEEEEGVYKTDQPCKAMVNVTYSLEIVCDFDRDGIVEIYTAEAYVYNSLTIDDMKLESFNFMGKDNYSVLVSMQDAVGQNFYMFRFYVNDELKLDKLSKYYITSDEMFEGQYVSNISFATFHHVKDMKDYDDERIVNMIFLAPDDKLEIEISEISKPYYMFIAECQKEMSGENPMFGGPAANIRTNIKGGACGFFTVFNGTKASCIVPEL